MQNQRFRYGLVALIALSFGSAVYAVVTCVTDITTQCCKVAIANGGLIDASPPCTTPGALCGWNPSANPSMNDIVPVATGVSGKDSHIDKEPVTCSWVYVICDEHLSCSRFSSSYNYACTPHVADGGSCVGQ
jgi:hypothetical protein